MSLVLPTSVTIGGITGTSTFTGFNVLIPFSVSALTGAQWRFSMDILDDRGFRIAAQIISGSGSFSSAQSMSGLWVEGHGKTSVTVKATDGASITFASKSFTFPVTAPAGPFTISFAGDQVWDGSKITGKINWAGTPPTFALAVGVRLYVNELLTASDTLQSALKIGILSGTSGQIEYVKFNSVSTKPTRINADVVNAVTAATVSNIIETTLIVDPPATLPAAPVLSIIKTVTLGTVIISWPVPTDTVTAFNLERAEPGSSFIQQFELPYNPSVDANELRSQDNTKTGTYQWRMRFKNSAGYSAYSNIVTMTNAIAVPTPPTNFTLTSQSGKTVSFSWVPPATGTISTNGYQIRTIVNGVLAVPTSPGPSAISSTFTWPYPDGTYDVWIVGLMNEGISPDSNHISLTTTATVPPPPVVTLPSITNTSFAIVDAIQDALTLAVRYSSSVSGATAWGSLQIENSTGTVLKTVTKPFTTISQGTLDYGTILFDMLGNTNLTLMHIFWSGDPNLASSVPISSLITTPVTVQTIPPPPPPSTNFIVNIQTACGIIRTVQTPLEHTAWVNANLSSTLSATFFNGSPNVPNSLVFTEEGMISASSDFIARLNEVGACYLAVPVPPPGLQPPSIFLRAAQVLAGLTGLSILLSDSGLSNRGRKK